MDFYLIGFCVSLVGLLATFYVAGKLGLYQIIGSFFLAFCWPLFTMPAILAVLFVIYATYLWRTYE